MSQRCLLQKYPSDHPYGSQQSPLQIWRAPVNFSRLCNILSMKTASAADYSQAGCCLSMFIFLEPAILSHTITQSPRLWEVSGPTSCSKQSRCRLQVPQGFVHLDSSPPVPPCPWSGCWPPSLQLPAHLLSLGLAPTKVIHVACMNQNVHFLGVYL